MTDDVVLPCHEDPDKWFGYYDDRQAHGRSAKHQQQIEEAKRACLLRCPALERRRCAQHALDTHSEHGVWAGVELGGPKRGLKAARRALERIAARDQQAC